MDTTPSLDRDALYELSEALRVLERTEAGVRSADIAAVEAYWHCARPDFSSAGFVLRLRDSRRAYLDVWVESAGKSGPASSKVDVELQFLKPEQKYPDFRTNVDPFSQWIEDAEALNAFLHHMRRSDRAA